MISYSSYKRDTKHPRVTSCHFDASGDERTPILVVAGFIAEAQAWADWEGEWLARLQADGLAHFHSKELRDWSKPKKERLINDLSEIIRNNAASKIGVAVVDQHLQATFSEQERKKWRFKAYSLAGRTAAREARIWADRWSGPMPELVFERGDRSPGYLTHLMESQGYPRPIFKSKKTFTDKQTGVVHQAVIPFQAADLLAHEIFIRMRVFVRDGRITKEFAPLPSALEKIPGECGTVEANRIKLLKHGLEQADSLILVPNVKIRTTP
jgi:hypothetical protein